MLAETPISVIYARVLSSLFVCNNMLIMSEVLKTILSHAVSSRGEAIIGLEPLADSGEVNSVFLVTTDSQKLVARVNQAQELARFQKEEWCINQAVRVGVRSPQVISVGSEGDTAYMLIEHVDGQRADKESVDQETVWRNLGQYAKQIHSVSVSGFGEELSDLTDGSLRKWDDYLAYNLVSLDGEDELQRRGIITGAGARQLQAHFKGLSETEFRFGLSHGDLSLTNAIMTDGEVCLIDWGSAAGHIVPHYDLGVILTDSISEDSKEFEQVLEGYELSREDFDDIKEEIKSLMLLIATDKVRWALERSPDSLDSTIQYLHKMLAWKSGPSLLRQSK